MLKLVTRLRFRSQEDQRLCRPLLSSTPSGSRHMSYTVPIVDPAPEPVLPDVPAIAPPSYDEPIVTRKELWSYYCMSYTFVSS